MFLSACGYVGEPLPPALNIPEKITDLRAVQRGPDIILEFTIPAITTEGLPMTIANLDLRAGPMPGGEFNITDWAASARPYPIESANAGYHKMEIPSADWAGKEVVLAIRTQHPRGRVSEWSNLEVLQVIPAIAAPGGLRADSTAPGIRLTWQAADPELTFRIYRRESSEAQPVLIGTAAGESEFLDRAAEYGKTYEYSVQAAIKRGEREAESLISPPVQVSRQDRFAPAVPSGLTAVAGTQSVELAWNPSPESDLAGYRIYRAVEGGLFEPVAELKVPSFSDRSAEPGRRYRYAVASVDQLGNESPRSEPLEILAQ
jgi:hypothetical protein